MHELVQQAGENVELDTLISYAYPYLSDREKISESIEKIKDYAEDSLPVLNKEKKIIGIIFNYHYPAFAHFYTSLN